MLRRGSGRIYSCLRWGSGGSPEPRGPPRSFFSLAKKDFPCLASQIVGSCSPFPGSGVTSEHLSLGNEIVGRAPISPEAASCWDKEMGSEGCRELGREMNTAADMFCIAERFSFAS